MLESFDYIESPKETYDYYKTHNLFGNEYADGDVTDYTWGKYSGYTYNVQGKSFSFFQITYYRRLFHVLRTKSIRRA